MKTYLITVSLAAGICASVLSDVQATVAKVNSRPNVVESKAMKSRGTGKDENVKSPSEVNDVAQEIQAPPSRGGEKDRGGFSTIRVENWTRWMVKIYRNKNYIGTVSSYGGLDFVSRPGTVGLYARAELLDDTSLYWGPETATCEAGEITTWKLH